MGHAIFAEVNGVHCRASGVDSGTSNVICFLFVFLYGVSPLWSDVYVFWKKWFLQKLKQNFDFFFVKFV